MSANDPTVPYGYCHCGCGQKTGLAKQTIHSRGLVKGEPNKYLPNHHKRSHPDPEVRKARNAANAYEIGKRWRRNNPDKAKANKQAYYERHRERLLRERRERFETDHHKEAARTAVGNAIKAGKLERGECEVGDGCWGAIHAHHDDYSKPLDVRWLCAHHHAQLHFAK